jgi:tetratricopeptide (TPR) repeat protein
VKRSAPTEAEKPAADEKKKGNAVRQEGSTREAVILPVSGATAPSCQEVLGGNVKKRNAPIAAQKETRLGNRELMLGNVPEAQAAYCKAFAWDRKNIDRHINLGRFFLFRRDWEKAAEFGQSALELDPKNRRALGVVGDAWAALDKPDEARSAWLAAERKSNASQRELSLMVRRNFALAKRVEKLKDFSLAERLYRRVLLLDAKHTGAMKGIASCLLKVGDYQGAEAWARRADMLKRNR